MVMFLFNPTGVRDGDSYYSLRNRLRTHSSVRLICVKDTEKCGTILFLAYKEQQMNYRNLSLAYYFSISVSPFSTDYRFCYGLLYRFSVQLLVYSSLQTNFRYCDLLRNSRIFQSQHNMTNQANPRQSLHQSVVTNIMLFLIRSLVRQFFIYLYQNKAPVGKFSCQYSATMDQVSSMYCYEFENVVSFSNLIIAVNLASRFEIVYFDLFSSLSSSSSIFELLVGVIFNALPPIIYPIIQQPTSAQSNTINLYTSIIQTHSLNNLFFYQNASGLGYFLSVCLGSRVKIGVTIKLFILIIIKVKIAMQRLRKRQSNLSFSPMINQLPIQRAQPSQKLECKNFHLIQSKQTTEAKDDLFSFNNFFSCELLHQPKLENKTKVSNQNISSWNGVPQNHVKQSRKVAKKFSKTEGQRDERAKNYSKFSTSFSFLPQKLTSDSRLDQHHRVLKTASDWLEKYEKINDEIKEIRHQKVRAKSLYAHPSFKLVEFTLMKKQENARKFVRKNQEVVQMKGKKPQQKSKQPKRGKWIICKDNFAQISRIYDFWS